MDVVIYSQPGRWNESVAPERRKRKKVEKQRKGQAANKKRSKQAFHDSLGDTRLQCLCEA